MSKRPRKGRVSPDSPRYIPTMMQRYDIPSDDPELRRLQSVIHNQTYSINTAEEIARDDMIRRLELARDSTSDEASKINLQMAIDRYRESHLDSGVSLTDLSGKVRSIGEARDIIWRLQEQTIESRDRRMRSNYDRALRTKGMTNLANWLLGLSNEDFKLLYYAQSNADKGFVYSLNLEDLDSLDMEWRRTAKSLGIKYNRELREVNSMDYIAEEFMETAEDSAARRIFSPVKKPKKKKKRGKKQ